MRRLLLPLLLLPASMIALGSAHAASTQNPWESIVKAARAQVVVPTDWDGIWATEDSLYLCDGTFQSGPTPGTDTLCGGKDYTASAGGIVFDCTGTADATTFDITCTGSYEVFTGCTANYNVATHGTRTGDAFFTVTTINVTYTGCPLPSSCTQVNSHGTRTGPTTVADCAVTPTKRSTWGQMKVIYR
jgi:hypothetical protein